MKDLTDVLSHNLRSRRKAKGMTQAALANRIGVTFQAVSKWETGRSAPDVFLLPTLASVLDCPIDALFKAS